MVKRKPKKSKLRTKTKRVKKTRAVRSTREPSFPYKARKIKIRVIGIGGGGGSIVSELALRVKRPSFVVANTDLQALRTTSRKALHFQFGQSFTRGLGTGMNPDLGKEAARSEKERIEKLFQGFDLCILVVSLGGGTGSGAAPVFAKISKDLGNITYGIFTLPFKFEGEKKMEIAKNALRKLKPKLDIFSVIPNERIFRIIDKKTPLRTALSAINKSLAEGLEGLIEVIYEPGLINIDFADFKTVLSGLQPLSERTSGKLAYLNTVKITRRGGSTQDLIEKVLNSSLYPYGIKGAKGVLLNIAGEKELSLAEVSQISKTISKLVNKEAKIIFGISKTPKHSGLLKTTLLATGCTARIFARKSSKKRLKKRFKKRLKKKQAPVAKSSQIVDEPRKEKPIKKKSQKPLSKKTKKRKSSKKKIRVKKAKIKTTPVPSSEVKVEVKIRKNALQIKREVEAEKAEMLAREKFWETPAFLRKKLAKDK